MKNEKGTIVLAGGVIGLIAAILVFFGNPANMGFCIACFLRDTTGALGLHSAAAVQYIRPEIIGLVLGCNNGIICTRVTHKLPIYEPLSTKIGQQTKK